jgi:hypothetical protein
MGRKVPLRCSVRIHRKLLRPFSDSLSRHSWVNSGISCTNLLVVVKCKDSRRASMVEVDEPDGR